MGRVLASAEQGSGLSNSIAAMLQKSFQQTSAGMLKGLGSQTGLSGMQGVVEKILYLTVLRAAIQKATESQHFNMETHINDLWTKLSRIRQSQSNGDTEKLQSLAQQQTELFDMMRQLIDKYNQAAKGIVQSIR
ncbi:MAG: hypothetical protein KIT09_05105 [Bryobacteraceae bacterium]|nr:hypothetical protein [Bryobacteraceae bacterium]